MNPTLLKLAKEAGFYVADGKVNIPTTNEDITACQEKFAELIIKECCTMVNAHMQRNNPYDCPLVLDIKKRFGLTSD